MDLHALKAKLDVGALIEASHGRGKTDRGGWTQSGDHTSLQWHDGDQRWRWWQQSPDPDQGVLGGDALAWIAHRQFGITRVDGERFQDVLREACQVAGVELANGQDCFAEAAQCGSRLPLLLAAERDTPASTRPLHRRRNRHRLGRECFSTEFVAGSPWPSSS